MDQGPDIAPGQLSLLLDPVDRALATAAEEDEEISEEEEQAVARSREWFKHNDRSPDVPPQFQLGSENGMIRKRICGES